MVKVPRHFSFSLLLLSPLFYHHIPLKSYQKFISTAINRLFIPSAFANRTIFTAVAVLCNLPSLYLSIIFYSLYWLVLNNFLEVEWAAIHPFFKVHYDPPNCLNSDRLPPFCSLSRSELFFPLNKQVYSKWQQVRKFFDTGSTTRYFFSLVKDRASYSLDLNFFLIQELGTYMNTFSNSNFFLL